MNTTNLTIVGAILAVLTGIFLLIAEGQGWIVAKVETVGIATITAGIAALIGVKVQSPAERKKSG